MTDGWLMDADCIHGVAWYECQECVADAPRPVLDPSCPFCPWGPGDDDYLLPTFTDGTWTMRRAHRYCMLVEVVGQGQADIAWGDRRRPG